MKERTSLQIPQTLIEWGNITHNFVNKFDIIQQNIFLKKNTNIDTVQQNIVLKKIPILTQGEIKF